MTTLAAGFLLVITVAAAGAAPPNPLEPRKPVDEVSPSPKVTPAGPTPWILQCSGLAAQTFTAATVTVGQNGGAKLTQTISRDRTMYTWFDAGTRGGKLLPHDCSLAHGSERYTLVQAIVKSYSETGGEVYGLSAASVTRGAATIAPPATEPGRAQPKISQSPKPTR